MARLEKLKSFIGKSRESTETATEANHYQKFEGRMNATLHTQTNQHTENNTAQAIGYESRVRESEIKMIGGMCNAISAHTA